MLISENSVSIDLNTAVVPAGGHLAAFGQLCHTNWLEAWLTKLNTPRSIRPFQTIYLIQQQARAAARFLYGSYLCHLSDEVVPKRMTEGVWK